MAPPKALLESNRLAIEYLVEHPDATVAEALAKYPGASDSAVRTYIIYHNIPYKKVRQHSRPKMAGDKQDPHHGAREAFLKIERSSAPVAIRLERLLRAAFDRLEKIWGPEIKK